MDNNAPWATGGAIGQRNFVEWTVGGGIERFEAQFRNGSRLFLEFPEGSEAAWVVSLSGSAAAMGRMAECMSTLRQGAGEAPRSAPTQPFGDAPRPAPPSQPFAPSVPQKPLPPGARPGEAPIRHAI